MPRILVLTGSIGMGKSTTADMFRDLGIPVWDADAAVARLYGRGGKAVEVVRDLAADAVVNESVDRKSLREAIGRDETLLGKLEARVHPLVAEDREQFLEDNATADYVLLDIPLYFETGAKIDAACVIVVSTSEAEQRRRVLARGSMTEAQFEMIKQRQTPDAQKRARADVVIETDTLEAARAAVQNLVSELRSGS